MDKLLTMGLLKSEKSGEKRIAVLPDDLKDVRHCDHIYVEKDYAKDFGISDREYLNKNCHVVTRETVLQQDILCETKIGEGAYLKNLCGIKTIFGWIHAGADPELTALLKNHGHTCYAWEDMYEKEQHIFWRNNQIAGAGGVFNALQYTGWMPFGKKAAILGKGDVAVGAYRMLSRLGVDVRLYSRKQEHLFQNEVQEMDIVVMAIRWDTTRKDHILNDILLQKMKKDSIIIDVSADVNGAIQNSITTSIDQPTYHLFNDLIYSVNNVPSIFYKTATEDISHKITPYLDMLIEQKENETLRNCKIIASGSILDQRIIDAQAEKNKQQH